jgi:hypothetical protein
VPETAMEIKITTLCSTSNATPKAREMTKNDRTKNKRIKSLVNVNRVSFFKYFMLILFCLSKIYLAQRYLFITGWFQPVKT